jgi:sec-independent protein translocase protein TatC
MTDYKMPLTEHLADLRKRITVSLVALMAGFFLCFNYSEDLFRALIFPMKFEIGFIMKSPFVSLVPSKIRNSSLIFTAPGEAFWMHLKVAFVAGLFLALPVIFHQLWKFISPGLRPKEKKYVVPFVTSATVLFLFGAGFCMLFVLPFAMSFLLTYKTESMTPMLSVGSYVDFCLKFILSFGAVFELPIAIIFLTRIGIVTPKTLAKNRKYAILVAFIVAAILTPTPDVFSQTLMAIPIIVLYEAGILLARILNMKKRDTGMEVASP